MNNEADNSTECAFSQEELAQYEQWLATFRRQFAESHGWSEEEAKERTLDCWAFIRDYQPIYVEEGEPRPPDAVPAFLVLVENGWRWPRQLAARLLELFKADPPDWPPSIDFITAITTSFGEPTAADEHPDITKKRQSAEFLGLQVLEGCEKAVAGKLTLEDFFNTVACAIHAGIGFEVLEKCRDKRLLERLLHAQQGKGGDELAKVLEAVFLDFQAKYGRYPTPSELAKSSSGRWSEKDKCWWWDHVPGMPRLDNGALRDRLYKLRVKHPLKIF
jgi:hypothetical protein